MEMETAPQDEINEEWWTKSPVLRFGGNNWEYTCSLKRLTVYYMHTAMNAKMVNCMNDNKVVNCNIMWKMDKMFKCNPSKEAKEKVSVW